VTVDRTQRTLAVVLAAQIALLALLHNPFARARTTGDQPLMPALASLTPERIEIAGSDSSSVTLERRSGAWVLGKPEGYPVLPGKVEKVIQDLEHLKAGRAVASERGSHAALKVADDQFERRVRLWAHAGGPPSAQLYVGSSPGYGVTHMRVAGSDRVYEVSGLSAFDIPGDPGSWIERSLVSIKPEELSRLEITNGKGSFALESSAGAWRIVAPTRSRVVLDPTKVLDLARTLCGLSIEQPMGPIDEAAQGFAHPAATVRLVKSAAGPDSAKTAPAEVTIRIGALVLGKPDAFYAARSGLDFAVSVARFSVDRALSAELKELAKAPAAANPPSKKR
jgi:hypothetical protein